MHFVQKVLNFAHSIPTCYHEVNGGSKMGRGIWGKCPPPPPPCGGAIFLNKMLNFVTPRSAYITHENMYILLAFITNSPEMKANQSQTSYEIVTMHLRAY